MRTLKNGQEVITEKAKYRVVNGELYRIDKETIPDFNLPWQLHPYANKGYDTCPDCGHDRNSPAGTGCKIGGHYGTYCSETISDYGKSETVSNLDIVNYSDTVYQLKGQWSYT